MSEFKYSDEAGKCILDKASPYVPRSMQEADKPAKPRLRTSYPGFLDYDELVQVLDKADQDAASADGLAGPAPKFLRQARKVVKSKQKPKQKKSKAA